MKRYKHRSYFNELTIGLVTFMTLITAACAPLPPPDHVTASGSDVCDQAYQSRSYRSIDELAQICGSSSTGPLEVSESSSLAKLATWSGPDGRCEYELPLIRASDTPLSYYTREILPQQSFRYFAIGMSAYSEVDIDCIESSFGSRLENFPEDPISGYAVSVRKAQKGCDNYYATTEALIKAGRVQLNSSMSSLRYYAVRGQTAYVPEALYIASIIERVCGGNPSYASQLASESIRAGYLLVSSQPLAGK